MSVLTPATPVLMHAGPESPTRTVALAQVRRALSMIIDDPYARSLLPHPDSESTALADWLYARWWCGPGLRGDQADPADPQTRTEAERGAARLEASRRTTAPRSGGWLVLAAVGDVLVAAPLGHDLADRANGHRRITTTPDAVVASSRSGLPPRPGDLVTVLHGSGGLDEAYGWWWAHSGRPEDLTDLPLDRWYVHVRDLASAARLVPLLLGIATDADCPVTLKCPPTEAGYGRRDALVVYLPRDRSRLADQALLRHAAEIAPLVRTEVPPLTRPLLPGVAQAEDPGPGADAEQVSYGQLRCRELATIAARLLGQTPARLLVDLSDDEVAAAVAATGIDLDAPERVS